MLYRSITEGSYILLICFLFFFGSIVIVTMTRTDLASSSISSNSAPVMTEPVSSTSSSLSSVSISASISDLAPFIASVLEDKMVIDLTIENEYDGTPVCYQVSTKGGTMLHGFDSSFWMVTLEQNADTSVLKF